jgi:hypothetical protein
VKILVQRLTRCGLVIWVVNEIRGLVMFSPLIIAVWRHSHGLASIVVVLAGLGGFLISSLAPFALYKGVAVVSGRLSQRRS